MKQLFNAAHFFLLFIAIAAGHITDNAAFIKTLNSRKFKALVDLAWA